MERFLLTLLVLGVLALGVWAMRRGWQRKAREQSVQFDPFPEVPDDAGPELTSTSGLYVATTPHGRWQERIVTRGMGMRGPATLRRHDSGIVVDRDGATDFFIPAAAITEVTTGKKLAGKVMGTDGLLIITWRLGSELLDTGFRGDDVDAYSEWTTVV